MDALTFILSVLSGAGIGFAVGAWWMLGQWHDAERRRLTARKARDER